MLEFLAEHNLTGLVLGLCSFLIIGLFHPLVIKGEYYMGVKCWWGFLAGGLISGAASLMVSAVFWQTAVRPLDPMIPANDPCIYSDTSFLLMIPQRMLLAYSSCV